MRSRWVRGLLAAFSVIVIAYGGVSMYMASSVTRAEREALEADPSSVGLEYTPVSFPSRDGSVELRGWRIPADNPLGTVVVVHGLDSNRASAGVGFLDIARGLVDAGFAVLMFDLRGHGESGEGQLSGGYFEQQDVLGAVDLLAADGERSIGLLGVSLGAAVSLLAAEREPLVHAVVADCTFADVADMVVQETRDRSPLPGWAVPALVPGMTAAARIAYGIRLGTLVPERAVAGIPYPVLLVHGLDDDRIPPEHSMRLKAASPSPDTELWMVPGAGHARAFRTRPDEYLQRVTAYLTRRLGQGGRP